MRRFRLVVAMVGVLTAGLAMPARAQERVLRTPNGEGNVFVWRDSEKHGEGLDLIRAGVHRSNPDLVLRLVACVVPSGTKAITTSGGFVTRDVLVTSGSHAGCRGNVAVEFLGR